MLIPMPRFLPLAVLALLIVAAWAFLDPCGNDVSCVDDRYDAGAASSKPVRIVTDDTRAVEPVLVGHGSATGAGRGAEPETHGARSVVRGRVVDPDGEPLGGVFVHAKGPGTRQQRRSAANGSFRFGDLRPGTYEVAALLGPGRWLGTAETVEVLEGSVDVELRLRRSTSVRVVVVGEDGHRPLEGLAVVFGPLGASTKTDASGAAVLEHLDPAWRGTLSVTVPDDVPYLARREPDWSPRDDLLVLERALALRGRVLDEQGRPLEAVAVQLRLDAVDQTLPPGASRSVRTDAEGRFAFRRLRRGTYRIRALDAGTKWGRAGPWTDVAAGDADIVLRAHRGVAMGVRIEGWPLETRGELTATSVADPEKRRAARIETDGTALLRGLEAGERYVLWGTARSGPADTGSVTGYVHGDGVMATEDGLTLTYREGRAITGRIRLPEDADRDVLTVGVSARGLGVWRSTSWIAADGGFAVPGLPPGTWELTATATPAFRVGEDGRLRPPYHYRARTTARAGEEDVVLTLERVDVR